jgi:TRAP-type mannitol/chloroaromatic compound transport system permease large subunit
MIRTSLQALPTEPVVIESGLMGPVVAAAAAVIATGGIAVSCCARYSSCRRVAVGVIGRGTRR